MSTQWPNPWPARPTVPPAGQATKVSGTSPGAEPERELVGATEQPTRLVGEPSRVSVPIDDRAIRPLHAETATGERQHRAYLDLDNIQADRNPGVVYGVYLNLPDHPSEQDWATHHVGNMSLFGVERARNPRGDEHGHGLHLSMEVTGLLDRLAADGSWKQGGHLDVTFRPLTLQVPAGRTDMPAETTVTAHPDHPITVGSVSVHYA